jgi:Protein of unknown function (DUF1822)
MTLLDVSTQPLLSIPASIQTAAWQNRSSLAPAWWNTYLNQVCLQTLLPWLQSEFDSSARVGLSHQETAWQLVNGTAINLGSQRLILIPSRTIDTSEFQVPQEWVDLPSWAGDFYLAIQVNPDDASLLVWGYATHDQLKTQGTYDDRDRTYTLDTHQLIRDFDTLKFCPQERAKIAPLPNLAPTQATQLVQRLTRPDLLQPRLEIPFQLWGALLEQHLGRFNKTAIAHLSQWVQNAVDESWQTLESLLNQDSAIAYQFRTAAELEAPTITQRIKVLDLAEQTVWLFVGIESDSDDRLSIRVQLRSSESGATLPAGLKLELLSNSGDVVQAITARDRDNGIQLKRFRCPLGTEFSLQISSGFITLTEDFVI